MQTRFILFELKKIALGEVLDGLDFGSEINGAFGMGEQRDSSTEEKVGAERLGSGSIAQNFGFTLICASMIFALLLIIIVVAVVVSKRIKLSEKAKSRIKRLKQLLFYNPMIRYVTLNSLKFNMAALVVLVQDFGVTSRGAYTAIVLFLMINALPFVFSAVLFVK